MFRCCGSSLSSRSTTMVFSSLTLNDAILFFAFLYSSSDIFVEWDAFESCKRPIQYWLVISYASIVAFRLSHYLGQCLSDDGEDFILYRQRGPPFWVNVLILGILFPFFFCWTIVGTVWFAQIEASTPQCLPRGSHPWFFVFWLVLCYVWITIYILFIAVAATFEYRARRAERDLQLLQNEDMLRRWGRFGVFAQYGIHIIRRGLTTEQIQKLPYERLTAVPLDQPSCSICLEDYHKGDEVRLLQACGHLFHKSCIDIWLLRNAVCPNCKSSIFTSNGGRLRGEEDEEDAAADEAAAAADEDDENFCTAATDISERSSLLGRHLRSSGAAAVGAAAAAATATRQEEGDEEQQQQQTEEEGEPGGAAAAGRCLRHQRGGLAAPRQHLSAFAPPGAEHLLPQNCV